VSLKEYFIRRIFKQWSERKCWEDEAVISVSCVSDEGGNYAPRSNVIHAGNRRDNFGL
jgi:hypothetical protein